MYVQQAEELVWDKTSTLAESWTSPLLWLLWLCYTRQRAGLLLWLCYTKPRASPLLWHASLPSMLDNATPTESGLLHKMF